MKCKGCNNCKTQGNVNNYIEPEYKEVILKRVQESNDPDVCSICGKFSLFHRVVLKKNVCYECLYSKRTILDNMYKEKS